MVDDRPCWLVALRAFRSLRLPGCFLLALEWSVALTDHPLFLGEAGNGFIVISVSVFHGGFAL